MLLLCSAIRVHVLIIEQYIQYIYLLGTRSQQLTTLHRYIYRYTHTHTHTHTKLTKT